LEDIANIIIFCLAIVNHIDGLYSNLRWLYCHHCYLSVSVRTRGIGCLLYDRFARRNRGILIVCESLVIVNCSLSLLGISWIIDINSVMQPS
jgi:hypothetical protein